MTKPGQAMDACREGVWGCPLRPWGWSAVRRLSLLPPCGVYCSCQQGHWAPSLHFITVIICLSVWCI